MTSQRRIIDNRTWQNDVIKSDSVNATDSGLSTTTTNATSSLGRRSNIDNEAALLWLPYVVFAIVLLCLIALSFVRFHYKRGLQYKLRQVELDRKRRGGGASDQDVEVSRTLLQSTSVFDNEGIVESPASRGLPYDVSPDVNSVLGRDNGRIRNGRPASAVHLAGNGKLDFHDEPHAASENSREVQRRKQQQQRQRRAQNNGSSGDQRQPVVFTFNANGSMVDVRCCEDDDGDERFVNNTFRFSGTGNADDTDATPISVIDLEKAAAAAEAIERVQNGSRRISDENHRHRKGRQRRWEDDTCDRISQTPAVPSSVNGGGHFNGKSGNGGVVRIYCPSSLPDRATAATAASATAPQRRTSFHPTANGYHSPRRQSISGRSRPDSSHHCSDQHQQPHHGPPHLGGPGRLLSPHRQPHRSRYRHPYHHQFNHSYTIHRDLAGTPLFHASLCGLGSGSSDEEIRRDSVAAEALQLWQKRV